MAVKTQWRSGFGGREGLIYPAIQLVIDERREWRRNRRQRFAEIQVMERAALEEWAKQQEERSR